MKNGIIIYLEDTECGNVRVMGKVVGNPDQSRDLAEEIMEQLMMDNPAEPTHEAPALLQ